MIARKGEARVVERVLGTGMEQDSPGREVGDQPADGLAVDRDRTDGPRSGRSGGEVSPATTGSAEDRRLPRGHSVAPGAISSTERGAPPCGGAGGRLHRQLYPAQRVCARGEAAPGRRTGGEVRDAAPGTRGRSTTPTSHCRGDAGGRWCSCWATRGCCGCDFSSGKT